MYIETYIRMIRPGIIRKKVLLRSLLLKRGIVGMHIRARSKRIIQSYAHKYTSKSIRLSTNCTSFTRTHKLHEPIHAILM